ncbi:hypothetical protein JCM11491_005296 [Sporobolomyces phaffii]
MDQPFPPALSTPSPTAGERADQSHAIWIAALALPLVIVVSGTVVAFLCWRRFRVDPQHWKELVDSPPLSSQDHAAARDALPPSTRPFPRPLVLLARTASVPPAAPPVPTRPTKHRTALASSTFSFPAVTTKISSSGTRVLTKKNGPSSGNWPPPISWPLELQTFQDSSETQQGGGGGGGGPSRVRSSANTVDLHRGLSLVSGYQLQSVHRDAQQLHQLVEEAKATRNSWTEGDDDVDHHFSTAPNHDRLLARPRARSLSSRSVSVSNYSHLTMGATTLGNPIDQEVARVSAQPRESDLASLGSTVPSLRAVATTRPLEVVRPRSSADLYSLRPAAAHVPFPRLPPVSTRARSRSSSHPDLPTTPSTYYNVSTVRDADAWFPPPLPYDCDATFLTSDPSLRPAFPHAQPAAVPVPAEEGRQPSQATYQRSDPLPIHAERARRGERPRLDSLVEWIRGKRDSRERERQRAKEQMNDW